MRQTNFPHSTPPSSGIATLILRYRGGDSEAGGIILHRFERYLGKWVRLLTKGEWNLRDTEIRSFLSLLGLENTHTAGRVLARRLECYEKEDLIQEVKLAFLVTCLRYWRLTQNFRYVLKDRVIILLSDPLTYGYHTCISYVDGNSGELSVGEACDIDQLWVDGITCSKPFSELTRQERTILRFVKWLGYSSSQTAKILGISPSAVDRALAHTREVLRIHYFDKR